MSEKVDLQKAYAELEETIKKGDHSQCLNISNKILSSYAEEKEALKSKYISLINLGKSDELISFIEEKKLEDLNLLEYAYALYDTKQYQKSIEILNKDKSNSETIKILFAQNYYKIGEYKKCYDIYKSLIEEKIKKEELENENDLFSNFLASYSLSKNNDEVFLKSLQKYISSWESYYNFAVIYLKSGNYENCFEILKRIKSEYPNLDDEFNQLKNMILNFYIIQNALDGFEINKYTNINNEYENFFKKANNKNSEIQQMIPIFYNNLLNFRKDKDSNTDTIKKLDLFIKNEKNNLLLLEKDILNKNKINFLIRGNRLQEAEEIINSILKNDDPDYYIYKSYLYYKTEKEKEKAIEKIFSDNILNKHPEPQLMGIQLMLSSLNNKSIESFHNRLMQFIKEFKQFCFNSNFISFFIGFYSVKKQFDYLKEFIREFENIEEINEKIKNKQSFKNIIIKIANALYQSKDYEKSVKFYQYYLDKLDNNDKDIKSLLIQSLSHINLDKSELLRREIDEIEVDLSNEHISSLLENLFNRNKRNDKINKVKKKRHRKKRFPKNFDPLNPGPMPDPERWLPRMQKKKYRNKNKLAHQGAVTDNNTTNQNFK